MNHWQMKWSKRVPWGGKGVGLALGNPSPLSEASWLFVQRCTSAYHKHYSNATFLQITRFEDTWIWLRCHSLRCRSCLYWRTFADLLLQINWTRAVDEITLAMADNELRLAPWLVYEEKASSAVPALSEPAGILIAKVPAQVSAQ